MAQTPTATPTANELRALLMVILQDEGDAEGVDRLGDMTDEEVMALAEEGAESTFASAHQDGETWETDGRYYRRQGGRTSRVANPNAPEPEPESGTDATPAPAQPAPEAEAAPEPEAGGEQRQPAAVEPGGETSEGEKTPAAFEKVLEGSAGEPPASRAATVASWIVAPVFPQTRQRVEEGLAQYLNGDHDIHKIVSQQAQKMFNDPEVPSVERAYAGVVSDLFSGSGKPFSESLKERLEPVRDSFRGDKLKINAINATTLGLAVALNTVAPGAGSALGGAIDEIASQIIEKDEKDWGVIAREATKAATIGVITRRLGNIGKGAGKEVAGKAAKAVAARTGSELAGKAASKAVETAAKIGTGQANKAIAGAIRGKPAQPPAGGA